MIHSFVLLATYTILSSLSIDTGAVGIVQALIVPIPPSTLSSINTIRCSQNSLHHQSKNEVSVITSTTTTLFLDKSWFDDDDVNLEDDEDGKIEPIVRRKRKNGNTHGGGPLDDHDILPFSVRKISHDPYQTRYLKEREKQKQKIISNGFNDNNNKENKRFTTPSRLIQKRIKKHKNGDGSSTNDEFTTVIGEYQLDKSTTSGDIIAIGEMEYQVQSARNQYRYTGGRFVMMRKILEVKELNRVQTEEALIRQYTKSSSHSSSIIDNLE